MATGGEVIEEEEGRRGGGLAEAPVAVVLKEGEQEGSVLDFIYCTWDMDMLKSVLKMYDKYAQLSL